MVANEPELVPSSERDNPFENGSPRERERKRGGRGREREREREREGEGVTQIIRQD
jgi:hypothetical protein